MHKFEAHKDEPDLSLPTADRLDNQKYVFDMSDQLPLDTNIGHETAK